MSNTPLRRCRSNMTRVLGITYGTAHLNSIEDWRSQQKKVASKDSLLRKDFSIPITKLENASKDPARTPKLLFAKNIPHTDPGSTQKKL